jgi:Flp pilus assembly protein TadB
MTVHQPIALFEEAVVHVAPPLRRNRGERVFDLHPGVHAMVAGAWMTFVAILCTAFMGPDLIVPAAIVVISVVALFVTPALWARVVPDDGLRRQSWGEFLQEGVECITGRLTAGQALAQIMTLPVLLVGLALVMAIIKATL